MTASESRRGILAAAAGALGGLLTGRLLGGGEARAASGEALVLGTVNGASAQTTVTSTDGAALAGASTAGPGLVGESTSHPGVRGASEAGVGVSGVSLAPGKGGVQGENASPEGRGVLGRSPGAGVAGESRAGIGVLGASRDGLGVVARSHRGTALQVEGAVRFRSAGLAIVRDGEFQVRVRPGVPIASDTLVLATLNGPDPERLAGAASAPITLWFVERDPDDDAFTIVLTERVQHDVAVGWFVLS